MVLGEIGGLYGAIVGIPSIFISYFVQLSYMSAISKLIPVKKENDSDLLAEAPSFKDKLIELETTSDMPLTLSQEHAKSLAKEASKLKLMPSVPLTKILCYFERFCKRNRWIETQKHFFEEFESKLDIESIVRD